MQRHTIRTQIDFFLSLETAETTFMTSSNVPGHEKLCCVPQRQVQRQNNIQNNTLKGPYGKNIQNICKEGKTKNKCPVNKQERKAINQLMPIKSRRLRKIYKTC